MELDITNTTNETKIINANKNRDLQLQENLTMNLKNGTLTKIYLDSKRYYFLYKNHFINTNIPNNLLVYYHGSRDIALDCVFTSTDIINSFGNENWYIIFGQCDGVIEKPYIHPNYNHIAYGEIYWNITYKQNMFVDIAYTNEIVTNTIQNYNIDKKVFIGHSNGGVFGLLLPIHLPNLFDIIISHQGGLGYDPFFRLDFELQPVLI